MKAGESKEYGYPDQEFGGMFLTDHMMEEGQIIITPLQLPLISQEYLQRLKEKRITAIAMEHLKYEDGSFPVIRIMSEIAGRVAILTAADLLSNTAGGRGVMLGGVSGVPPAKVVTTPAGVIFLIASFPVSAT